MPARTTRLQKLKSKQGVKDSTPWEIRREMGKLEANESDELRAKRVSLMGHLDRLTRFFLMVDIKTAKGQKDQKLLDGLTLKEWDRKVKDMDVGDLTKVEHLVAAFREMDFIDGTEPLNERLNVARKSNAADIAIRDVLGFDPKGDAGWMEEGEEDYTEVELKGFDTSDMTSIDKIRDKVSALLDGAVSGKTTEGTGAEGYLESLKDVDTDTARILMEDSAYQTAMTQAAASKEGTELKNLYARVMTKHDTLENNASPSGAFNQIFNINRLTALASAVSKLFSSRKNQDLTLDDVMISLKAIAKLTSPGVIMKCLDNNYNDADEAVSHDEMKNIHGSTTIMTPNRLSDTFCSVTSIPSSPGSVTMCTDKVAALMAVIAVSKVEAKKDLKYWTSSRSLMRLMATGFKDYTGKNVSRVNRNFMSVKWRITTGSQREIIINSVPTEVPVQTPKAKPAEQKTPRGALHGAQN